MSKSKRPMVVMHGRRFVSGDTWLVVYSANRIQDIRKWRIRPSNNDELEQAAKEWLIDEGILAPPGDQTSYLPRPAEAERDREMAIIKAAIVLAREPFAVCAPNAAEMKFGRLKTAVDNYLDDVPERPSEAAMREAAQIAQGAFNRDVEAARRTAEQHGHPERPYPPERP